MDKLHSFNKTKPSRDVQWKNSGWNVFSLNWRCINYHFINPLHILKIHSIWTYDPNNTCDEMAHTVGIVDIAYTKNRWILNPHRKQTEKRQDFCWFISEDRRLAVVTDQGPYSQHFNFILPPINCTASPRTNASLLGPFLCYEENWKVVNTTPGVNATEWQTQAEFDRSLGIKTCTF